MTSWPKTRHPDSTQPSSTSISFASRSQPAALSWRPRLTINPTKWKLHRRADWSRCTRLNSSVLTSCEHRGRNTDMTQNGNGNGNAFNPQDNLVKIKSKDGSQKDYYPAAWRLYELSLKYPNANFSSEVLYFDVEKNTCLVKVRLYLGADYAQSDKKAEAHKSGPYTSLDKVETAAMARAARNFGIGTEYALEFEAEDMAPAESKPRAPKLANSSRLNEIYKAGKAAG